MTKFQKLAWNSAISSNILILGFLYSFYSLLFLSRIHGFGNYWDAVFPYFKNQIPNFFNSQDWSWVATVNGPLKYSSDYFFRFLVSRITFLQPEHLLFLLYVSLFAFGSFGIYLIVKSKHSCLQSLIIGLVVFVSPALFYKLNAGHLDYLASFVIFIFLLLYLLKYFNPTKRGYLILALFLAFIGVEIQFFILSFIVVLIYFFIWREKFIKNFFLLLILIPTAINLPWFLNSIDGAVSLTSLSTNAAMQSFPATLYTSFLSIFDLSFSQATQLNKYYPSFDFIFFAIVFLILLATGIYSKMTSRKIFFILNFVLFIFLGTGIFQNFDLGPLDLFYPMFRESGHFAPLIILFLLLFWSEIDCKTWLTYLINTLLVIFVLLNAYQFLAFTNQIDFGVVRNEFSEFESFFQNNSVPGRVMTYPLFDPDGFINFDSIVDQTGYPLNNTGYDSFIMFSGLKYVNNIVPAYQFHSSLQYQLLTNQNIDFFAPFSIDYLFDFSSIYQSYYEKYTAPNTYDNNLSFIKDNPGFIPSLLNNDPGSLIQISPDIYKIPSARPYISSFSEILTMGSTTDAYSVYKTFPDLSTSFYYVRVPFINSSQILLASTTAYGVFSKGSDNPKSVTYMPVNPTRDTVYIVGATEPFFLALSENYGAEWRLEYGDVQSSGFIQKWSPLANIPRIPDIAHYELNDALNGWYVDPQQVCNSDKAVCTQNPDGSYNIDMTIEFWPQRWMDFGFVISGITFVSCIGYILYDFRKKKNRSFTG